MDIKQIKHDNKIKFELGGTIDQKGAEELKERFNEVDSSIKEVVLNLSKVTHIGSAGIGKIMLLYKKMAMGSGEIKIERVPSNIYDLFKVVKLDTIIPISK